MNGEQTSSTPNNTAPAPNNEWENLTNAQRFQQEQAEREARAVDPEELAWYQEHLDKLGDLIAGEDPEKEEWYREHPDKIDQLIFEKDQRNAQAKLEEANKRKQEDEEKARLEEKERARIEEEEKRKLELEELAKLEEEAKQREEELKRIEAELAKRPLVAINADFTHDKKELAHDFAEQELNAEVAAAKGVKGLVSRIWKGNLFKKYYQKKYEREIESGERKFTLDGEQVDIDDVVDERSGSAIKRFVVGVTEEYDGMVHTKAGEKLSEADAETTTAVKDIISWFAGAEIPEGGSIEDLRTEFGNRVNRLKAERQDDKKSVDEKLINNYYEVALQARQRAEHGIAIDRVMEGFRVYNADVRNNIRTEAHRDNIDKIVNKYESSKLGQFIPPEIIAAALSTTYALTQTGARAAAGAGLGIGVSGLFAGLRERNRVTEDRARMMRDAAVGLAYSGTNGEEVEGGRIAKKRAKYEARIGGTLYDLQPASKLTADLNAARESGDHELLLKAIAEARVRVDYSDAEKKDLISYSSADRLGDERLALDLALIRAEKSLSQDEQTRLGDMRNAVQKSITENVEKDDKDFRSERRKLAAKASAKTVALGAAFFFGSQEIMAAIDPNKIGVFEKVGLLKTKNTETAEETILAGAFGRGKITESIKNISGDRTVERQQFKDAGYKEVKVKDPWTETTNDIVDVKPSASDHKLNTIYDGWANNGTKVSDGNELRAYLENGQFRSGMFGNSTFNGQTLNYDELAAAGRIKGYITVGGAKFELQGTMGPNGLTWGQNGVFTTATGETIKAIGDNGEKLYKYFEIALDNGTDANGFSHIIPFATDVGRDTFSGTIKQAVETVVEHPAVYDYVKEIPRTIFTSGVVVPAVTSRIGLGGPTETAPGNNGGIIDIYTTPGYEPGIPTFVNPNPEGRSGSGTPPTGNEGNTNNVGNAAPAANSSSETDNNGTVNPDVNSNGQASSNDDNAAANGASNGANVTNGTTTGAANTAPNAALDPTESAKQRINDFFGDAASVLGNEGLDIMTSTTSGDLAFNQRIINWLIGLDEETRNKVYAFEEQELQGDPENKSDAGIALRMMVQHSLRNNTPNSAAA